MEVIENASYTGQRIELDGKQFNRCTFENCLLVYSGQDGTSLSGCQITNTSFTFEGAAAKTLELLHAMYRGGFQELVDATIEGIRGGTPAGVAAPQA